MTYTVVPLPKVFYPEYEESLLSPLMVKLAASTFTHPRRFLHRRSPSSKNRFDLTDDENEFHFTIDIPGVELSEINVAVEEGGSTLRVEVQRRTRANGAASSFKTKPNFSKAFTLKGIIDSETVSATTSQGMLHVHGKKLPKESVDASFTKELDIEDGFPENEASNEGDEGAQKPHFETTLELPGVKPSDLNVTVSSTSLTDPFVFRVSGSRRTGTSNVQKFSKLFSIGRSVDISRTTAHLAHGMLLLQGPKDPKYDPIEVTVSQGEEIVAEKEDKSEDEKEEMTTEDGNVTTNAATRTHLVSAPRGFYYELSDNEREIRVVIETPGMKASDLSVKVEDAGRVIRVSGRRALKAPSRHTNFERTFSVTKYPVDVETVAANLHRGVLTVHADKASPNDAEGSEKHRVVVEEGSPSSATDDEEKPESETPKYFETTIELPGVKPSDLKVEVEDGSHGSHVLHVSGSRTAGTSQKFARKFKIGRSVDVKQLTAHLNYGVLALQAPKDARYEPVDVTVEEGETKFNKTDMEELEDELVEKDEIFDGENGNEERDGKPEESWEAVEEKQT